MHVYDPSGFVSSGPLIGDVASIRRDVPAVVSRISRDLFLDDIEAHERRISGSVPPDFDADLDAAAVLGRERSVAAE